MLVYYLWSRPYLQMMQVVYHRDVKVIGWLQFDYYSLT